MTPNPYQSPREAGYNRPQLLLAILIRLALIGALWITFAVAMMATGWLRWQAGF